MKTLLRLWSAMGHHCDDQEIEEDGIAAVLFVILMLYGMEWLILF